MPQGLTWGRIDSHWYEHPKFAGLLNAGEWRAVVAYWAALGYSVGHGTDGYIDPVALPLVRARPRDAVVLLDCGLWAPAKIGDEQRGYDIHGFAEYQQTTTVTAARREQAARAARVRWDK
jgi:hypothetical protein